MARKPPQRRTTVSMDPDDENVGVHGAEIDSEEEEEEEEEEEPEEEEEEEEEEPEEEEEEEEEEPEEEEEEEEEEPDDLDPDTLRQIGADTVPHSVVGELRRQVRDLTAAMAGTQRQQQQAPAAPTFDIDAKTKERNEKLLEGDTDAASAIDKEIRTFVQQSTIEAATAAAQQVIANDRVASAIADIQRKYPVLDDNRKKSFNPDVLDLVLSQRNLYIGRGMSVEAAIRKAAKVVCESTLGAPRRREEERGNGALSLRQKQKQVDRAGRQPPRVAGSGSSGRVRGDGGDLTEGQIAGMSDAKFRQLDPKVKARERGDIVGSGKRPKRR